ncbi:MAG TPA: glutamine--tRNA ligase/YqeY domain fusion protein [Clostridia bacterium]|nr:glutamine--tRNA ligase/YqeY domain fusion protein [Clostridia bacterium]
METESRNFIEDIIINDLKSGKHTKIITRFPPEPNGYLHIGHAKAICINFGIKEQFGGECNLRFDDTNPVKEDNEYVDAIQEDIKWLGFEWDKLCYASDYFEEMYNRALLLVKKGLAYVCDLSAEEISATRGTLTTPGTNSPYRNRSVEENLDLFQKMREGAFKDGEKCLRAKIDMAAPNINMRDPVIYRVLRAEHPHTGNKWLIYPIYDFAHPLEDAIEGITHSLCSLEFEDHRPLYDWFAENCEFDPRPRQIEFARLNLTRAVMSKRYLKKLVDEGTVCGWDDPRLSTLRGMRKRGYPPEAIRDFCGRIGVAKSNSEVDVAILEHCVREFLNERATRVMVVTKPLKLIVDNYPQGKSEEIFIENNPQDISAGVHTTTFSRELFIEADDFSLNPPPKYFRLKPDGIVRLKGAYIVKYASVDLGESGEVEAVHCEYIEDSKTGGVNAGMKVKGTIHFVDSATAIDVKLNMYDSLILDGEEDFSERINPNSHIILNGKAEYFLKETKEGERFQFMRDGYFVKTEKENEYNSIVSLKDTYNK